MQAIHTIEVGNKPIFDNAVVSDLEQKLREIGIENAKASSTNLYTLVDENFLPEDLDAMTELVSHDITQFAVIDKPIKEGEWDFAIRIDYKPGVTDNAARVLARNAKDILLEPQIFTSAIHYIKGKYDPVLDEELRRLASNPQVHDITVLTREKFIAQNGFERKIHPVNLGNRPNMFYVRIGSMDDDELKKLGSLGTLNTDLVKPGMAQKEIDNLRGGTLALKLDFLHAINDYSLSEKNTHEKGVLTDTEIETFGQMWSDHCRHIWYNAIIPGTNQGIFSRFIRAPTMEVLEARKKAGLPDLGVSVFKDNSGVFYFNEKWNVAIKNETHNSPSALDPYGGAITGIVGVNRDPAGTGMGGEVIGNAFCYWVGRLEDREKYFKSKSEAGELSDFLLNPNQILSGVNKGVEHGGNQMGIPTNLGRVQYHERYNGKPIVEVISWARMPHEIHGRPAHEKHVDAGDRLYILGGRAGKDGIHGATFSSEALTKNSPATAVQIGDAYTQRKLFEAILELRDNGYIKFITDLGAGGVSCAALEMAEETNGLDIDIDKLLQKYPGMTATELFLNESQERMAIAVDEKNKEGIEAILKKHDVEFSDIGMFTNSGRAHVSAKGQTVVDLDMEFIHKGYPVRKLTPKEYKLNEEQQTPLTDILQARLNLSDIRFASEERSMFYKMMARPNLGSIAPLMDVMDSSVKGLGVQHCIQGKGRVTTQASCTLVDVDSSEGLIIAYGHAERQSYIDSKQMAINSFMRSMGHNIAMGGRLDHMLATDQALWQSPQKGEYQQMLIEANEGMADAIRGFQVPVISGKDSMSNQAIVYDAKGREINRGVYPTLEIITAAKIDDVNNIVTVDAKELGDLVYVVGSVSKADMGGSEYANMVSDEIGKELLVGKTSNEDIKEVYDTFKKMNIAQNQRLLQSAIYVEQEGLVAALKNTSSSGELGLEADLDLVHQEKNIARDALMYGETEGRFVITIRPEMKQQFEELFVGKYSMIGKVTGKNLVVKKDNAILLNESIDHVIRQYHKVAA